VSWVEPLISGAAAVAGGVVVAVSNYGVRRADAEDAQQAELRAASVAFSRRSM
jgi:hypothetical protein